MTTTQHDSVLYSLFPLPHSGQTMNNWRKARLGSILHTVLLHKHSQTSCGQVYKAYIVYLPYMLSLLSGQNLRNTHKVSPDGRYREWCEKVSKIRLQRSLLFCTFANMAGVCEERSGRWHYTFMMIIYLFCQVNPIRMPGSYSQIANMDN